MCGSHPRKFALLVWGLRWRLKDLCCRTEIGLGGVAILRGVDGLCVGITLGSLHCSCVGRGGIYRTYGVIVAFVAWLKT